VMDHIWTGVIGDPVPKVVAGYTTNPDGDTVYDEGAYSGEVPATVQNNYYGCITEDTGRIACNIVEATSSGIAVQRGDSGGPIVRYINGSLYVTGIVAAGQDQIACQYNTQYAQTCFQTVFYTAMTEIMSQEYPGASLVG